MTTQPSRADEIADVLGDNVMSVSAIIQTMQQRYPTVPLERLAISIRAVLSKNPDRFERIGETLNYRLRRTPIQYQGTWPTKKAFVMDHLHLPVMDVIELGKRHRIELTKATVYGVRYNASKQGADISIVSREEFESRVSKSKPNGNGKGTRSKTTTTLVHTEATGTETTIVSQRDDDSLDSILMSIIDEEIKVNNVREQIAALVRQRVQVLGPERIKGIIREYGDQEAKAFFKNT